MHLKGLTPDHDYWLWIAGTDINGTSCSGTPTIANPVTADANGNISYNFTFDEVPAQGAVWVGASGGSGDIRVQSTAIELTYPGTYNWSFWVNQSVPPASVLQTDADLNFTIL